MNLFTGTRRNRSNIDAPMDTSLDSLAATAGEFTPADLEALRMAKFRLESPSFAMQVADLIGHPFERALNMLPGPVRENTDRLAYSALIGSLNVAVNTMKRRQGGPSRDRLHRWLGAGTGALGGLAGFWSLAVELPVSTTLMLRSIADIAAAEGQDLTKVETRLDCIQVFALGGPNPSDNAAESGYWIVRAGMSKAFTDAAAYATRFGLQREAGPPLARLISAIAARFSADVAAQSAVRMIPVVSAASAAAVNVIFTRHFQEIARGHFTVRRLEAKYGQEEVANRYRAFAGVSHVHET